MVARGERDAGHLGAAAGAPGRAVHRRVEAEHLVDGVRPEVGVVDQARPLFRMREELDDAVAVRLTVVSKPAASTSSAVETSSCSVSPEPSSSTAPTMP